LQGARSYRKCQNEQCDYEFWNPLTQPELERLRRYFEQRIKKGQPVNAQVRKALSEAR